MSPFEEQDITEKLRIRANIRRTAKGRKSVEEGKPDRLADLLDEAALEIDRLTKSDAMFRKELRDISQAINMDELDLTMTASECIMKLHAEIDELREYKKCVGPDYYDCATKLNAALKKIEELKNEGETLLEMFRVANQQIERMGDQHDAAMKEIERLNIIISGKTFS